MYLLSILNGLENIEISKNQGTISIINPCKNVTDSNEFSKTLHI